MSDQGVTYAAFIARRLASEQERRTRIEARAASITTTSTTLLTLVAALTALLAGKDYTFSTGGKLVLVVSFVAFGVASGCSLAAGLLRKYTVPAARSLKATVDDHWPDKEVQARLACAWMDLETLLSLRGVNDKKTWWLDMALWTQLGAVSLLAIAVILQLTGL